MMQAVRQFGSEGQLFLVSPAEKITVTGGFSTGLWKVFYRARICKPFKEPGIDSQPGGPVRLLYLTYWPAGLYKLVARIDSGLLKTFTNTG